MGGFENNPSPQKHLLHHSLIFIFMFTGNAMYRTTRADLEIPSLRSRFSSLVFFFTERSGRPEKIVRPRQDNDDASLCPLKYFFSSYLYISHFWGPTPIFLLILLSYFSLLGGFSPALKISEMIVVEHQDNAILLNPIFILLFSFPFFSGKCIIC